MDGDGVLLVAGRYLKSKGQLKGGVIVGTTMANLGLERALEKRRTQAGAHGRGRPLRARRNAAHRCESGRRTIRPHSVSRRRDHRRWNADGSEDRVDRFDARAARLTGGGFEDVSAEDRQRAGAVEARARVASGSFSRCSPKRRRCLGNSGRVVLRYSGTEPLARVMVEAEREEDVRRWTEALASAVRSSIGA